MSASRRCPTLAFPTRHGRDVGLHGASPSAFAVPRVAASEEGRLCDSHGAGLLLRRVAFQPRCTGSQSFDWIAVWIEDLDLLACWSGFHGVPKRRSGAAQCFDDCGQVAGSKNKRGLSRQDSVARRPARAAIPRRRGH